MQEKRVVDVWKPAAIVLAILILLSLAGMVVLFIFGNAGKSTSEEGSVEKTELTASIPSEKETETLSSITVTNSKVSAESQQESTPVGSHRYEVVTTRMTWAEAAAYCEERGGYLATIQSQEEYEKVKALADASGRKVLWLGAERNTDQSFSWITGEEFSYSYWLSGEPNNEGGNENCLVMFSVSGQWVWADVPNDVSPYYAAEKVGFVCEYNE